MKPVWQFPLTLRRELPSGGINVKEKLSGLDKKIRDEDLAWSAIEGEIKGEGLPEEYIPPHQCEHTPDKLQSFDLAFEQNKIIVINECKCGKKVREYFNHTHTNVAE